MITKKKIFINIFTISWSIYNKLQNMDKILMEILKKISIDNNISAYLNNNVLNLMKEKYHII